MLIKYYFKIKHIKGTDNTRADVLSRKVLDTILRLDKDKKIRYNYL